jgi:hypothetical protein
MNFLGGMAVFAGSIAAVFSAIAFLASFLVPDIPFLARLGIAAMVGAITFVASAMLCLRDRWRMIAAMQRVHQRLLAKDDIGDESFCRAIQIGDDSVLLDIRCALADFFDVPPAKIHPGGDLCHEYQYRLFEPGLHAFAVVRVLTKRHRDVGSFVFTDRGMKTVGDLAKEISRILAKSQPMHHQP